MKIFLLVIILLVVFAGIIWFSGRKEEEISSLQPTLTISPSPTPTPPSSPSPSPTKTATPTPTKTPSLKTVVINMTDSGFVPSNMTINIGDTVKFINQSSQARWPASAVHPTHDLYPEKGGCISSKFDACRGLQSGENFSFTFRIKGTWPYHDHLNSSLKGTVIVQ